MLKNIASLVLVLSIIGCASGGGSAGLVIEPPTSPPPTNTETDKRYLFEEFS